MVKPVPNFSSNGVMLTHATDCWSNEYLYHRISQTPLPPPFSPNSHPSTFTSSPPPPPPESPFPPLSLPPPPSLVELGGLNNGKQTKPLSPTPVRNLEAGSRSNTEDCMRLQRKEERELIESHKNTPMSCKWST